VIVRLLTARVPSEHADQFNRLIRGKLDVLHSQPGLVYAKLARRLSETGDEEVVLFEEWATPADLWEWTGGHLTEPRLLPDLDALIQELSITHYEALDREVEGTPIPLDAQRVVLRGGPGGKVSAVPDEGGDRAHKDEDRSR
jgi:quinol monooxygenase YgiN